MENTVKLHDDDESILILTLNKELKDWKKNLDFIEKELIFLRSLLESTLAKSLNKNKEDKSYLHNTLKKVLENNKMFYNRTINFTNKTLEIRECEDMHCEAYFFNEHFEFHNKLNKHLEKVRNLKLIIFNFLEKNN
ncbi:hypothetical protein [Mesonia aquimarina]|uniref:hypothetical protein n=1 Tax=Mesonia aquimarina TaxID=1504967 RepID=UPI000EF628B5|nr:hypothetical protein [Mesonia aquimarina]